MTTLKEVLDHVYQQHLAILDVQVKDTLVAIQQIHAAFVAVELVPVLPPKTTYPRKTRSDKGSSRSVM